MVNFMALDPKTLTAMAPAAMLDVFTRLLCELSARTHQIEQHQQAA